MPVKYWSIAITMLLLSGCATVEVPDCCPDTAEPTRLEGESLRVVSLNIAHGRGTSLNQMLVSKQGFLDNLDAVADLLIRIDPDIAALQEVDAPSRWSGKFDHLGYIRNRTGWREHIHGDHQQGYMSRFGTALVSPHDLQGEHSHRFRSSWPTTTKGFVTATLDWQSNGQAVTLTVFSVHLDFSRKKVRQAQIDELIEYINKVDGPIIVAGDFNGEWVDKDSAVFELIEELDLLAWDPDAENQGSYKELDGKRLDWILISEDLRFTNYTTYPDRVSDHLAVVADIVYAPE